MSDKNTRPIVIIGTGLAGYNFAKEFRKLNPTHPLVLITQDDGHFYSKPQLSTALLQGKTPQSLIISDCQTMQGQLAATIYTFTTVVGIHPLVHEIELNTPQRNLTLAYEHLVLAMGAQPNPFPLGEPIAEHFRINSLYDYAHVRQLHPNPRHLTIIGSGLVGCEFAHDFAQANIPVSVISPEAYPLYRFVPQVVGQALQQALASRGIEWHTQTTIERIEKHNEQVQLQLNNGQTLQTAVILSAIGLKPNTGIAQQADLKIKQGIVVNEYLQTSAPHIYALGDCAEIFGECRYFVSPLLQCARALAQTLCGKPTPVSFMPTPIVLKMSSYPVTVLPLLASQIASQTGQWQFEERADGIKGLYYDENKTLCGYVLTGSFQPERQQIQALLFKEMA